MLNITVTSLGHEPVALPARGPSLSQSESLAAFWALTHQAPLPRRSDSDSEFEKLRRLPPGQLRALCAWQVESESRRGIGLRRRTGSGPGSAAAGLRLRP